MAIPLFFVKSLGPVVLNHFHPGESKESTQALQQRLPPQY